MKLLEEEHGGMPFKPRVNGSEVADSSEWIAASAPDGWIVALDFGEWGGKVIWVSRDGAKQVDVSNDQIQSLIGTSHGVFAIGLATPSLFLPNGLIQISRGSNGVWRTWEVSPFPYNDAAMTMLDNGRLLLGSRAHFFTYDIGGSLNELKDNVLPSDWHVQGPRGSSHGQWTFVGDMFYLCQDFKIEVNLTTGQRRCLVPDKRFLNDGGTMGGVLGIGAEKNPCRRLAVEHRYPISAPPIASGEARLLRQTPIRISVQLDGARGRIEQCYKLHGLRSANAENQIPFRKLILEKVGPCPGDHLL